MSAPLLHLATPAEWRTALASGGVTPPSLADVGFVHLSTPEQVALPATRLYAGRGDLVLLVLDPARLGVEVRYEPGVPGDPASMCFPHAYGPVPTSAVLAVVPYRPGPGGTFTAPAALPTDRAGRTSSTPSLLRRVATTEIPVAGGVAVITAPVPRSRRHNQLLIDGDASVQELVDDADRVLGGAGLPHRAALLVGDHHAASAAGLGARGWAVQPLLGMAADAGGVADLRVETTDRESLRPLWDAGWRRELPAPDDATLAQLTDRHRLEEAAVDLRYLGVRIDGTVVASCLLKIDGATAVLDAVATDAAHRGRGHGDALVATGRALAADAGCDLVVLEAATDDWPRHWYARRGFVEVEQLWEVTAGG